MPNAFQGGFLRDASTGALVVSAGASGASFGAAVPAELKRKLWLPTGMTDPSSSAAGDAIDESCPRINGAQTVTLASQTLYAVGNLVVPAGRTVTSITFHTAGSGAAGITGTFFALVRQSDLAVLAKSADDATAWPANSPKTLKMTTPWVASVDTPVYAVVCINATTPPSLTAYASHIQSINRAPVFAGSSNSAIANAAALPATINAPVQAAAGVPYASINSTVPAPAADTSEGLSETVLLGSISTSGAIGIIKPVMFPITVYAASLVLNNTTVPASDTDYWTVELGRVPSLSSTFGSVMATKTTQATGGAAFFNTQAWTFDAVTFNPANQTLTKDDILAFRFTKTGAPATLQAMTASVRWQVA